MKGGDLTSTLVIIAMGLIALSFLLGSGQDMESVAKGSSLASIYNAGPSGMKGFYLILKKWNPNIQRWKRPLYGLKEQGTLLIANPIKPLSPLEDDALNQWIRQGGMVVLMRVEDWNIEKTGYQDIDETQGFLESYGITDIDNESISVFLLDEIGKLIIVPSVYDNKTLQSDPQQAIELVQEIIEHGGPIYFDEYHLNLGENDGFVNILKGFLMTKWGHVILHLFFVFLLAMLVFRRSQLAVEQNAEKQKSSSSQLIVSRGRFLQSAQAKEFCEKAINQYSEVIR